MFALLFITLRACCWQCSVQMAPVCASGIADCSEEFTPPFEMSKRLVNPFHGNFGEEKEIWLKIVAALSTWPKAMMFSGQSETQTVVSAVARTKPALHLTDQKRLCPPPSLSTRALLDDVAFLGRYAGMPFVWHLCTRQSKRQREGAFFPKEEESPTQTLMYVFSALDNPVGEGWSPPLGLHVLVECSEEGRTLV